MFEALVTEGDDVAILVFPYHRDFIEALKELVPHVDRSYDPDEKDWTIKIDYLDDVLALAADCWPRSTWKVVTDDAAKKTTRTNVETAESIVQNHMF